MERITTKLAVAHSGPAASAQLFENWFDPIESGLREQVRYFIESPIETELEEALSRPRYGRLAKAGGSFSEGADRPQRAPARPSIAVAFGHIRRSGD